MLSPALIGMGQSTNDSVEAAPTGPDAMVLGRIKLDQEVANQDGVFERKPAFSASCHGSSGGAMDRQFWPYQWRAAISHRSGTVTAPFHSICGPA